ncbi:MAG: hypothetical protein ACLUSP_01705 [Christensenellales bacterium]
MVSVESAAAVVLVVARTLSGVHWLTDIIGSVILSLALVSCFTEYSAHSIRTKR